MPSPGLVNIYGISNGLPKRIHEARHLIEEAFAFGPRDDPAKNLNDLVHGGCLARLEARKVPLQQLGQGELAEVARQCARHLGDGITKLTGFLAGNLAKPQIAVKLPEVPDGLLRLSHRIGIRLLGATRRPSGSSRCQRLGELRP